MNKKIIAVIIALLIIGGSSWGWYYFYYDEDGNQRIPSPLIETKKETPQPAPEPVIEAAPAPVLPRVYKSSDEDKNDDNSCHISDGTHSATVEYTNPDTGYEATYNLEVQVRNCEVIEIDFPKGGWLDGDHIDPTELDEDGNASIEDDRGRTWDVHIDD